MLVGDHSLNSVEEVDSAQYIGIQGMPYQPSPMTVSQPFDYSDLIHIRSEDLLCVEAPECLNNLINEDCDDKQAVPQIQEKHQVLPDLEEHDKGGVSFELNLAPQHKCKVNWLYSNKLKKIYIKLNETFNVEVVYNATLNSGKIYMRIMMVFNSEVSKPVIQCKNHSSQDSVHDKHFNQSILRCENPNAQYLGSVEGKNISDRLSVRIPLGCVPPNEDNTVKQTVALKFVCQNSCVGRRETSIIFYLENSFGEILAKRVTGVKICSCPKRDMKKDEGSELSNKRSRKDECPAGKKILKLDTEIKVEMEQENEDKDDCLIGAPEANDIVVTPNGLKLTLELPNWEAVRHVAECAFNKVAGQMALNPDNVLIQSKIRPLKKIIAKAQKQLRDQSK